MLYSQKILITIETKRRWLLFFEKYDVVQNKTFNFSLKIKNVGSVPFKGGMIEKLQLKSASGKSIYHPINKVFHLPSINPSEEYVLDVGKMFTLLCGESWVSFILKPENQEDNVFTYQLDRATKEIAQEKTNYWADGLLIFSQQENSTSSINSLLLALTVFTTWQAVFGLKDSLLFILKTMSSFLDFINSLIKLLI